MPEILDQVKALYERQPYPEPAKELDEYRDHRRIPQGTPSSCFNFYWPHESPRKDLDILIAGCGTSQAVEYALWEPESRIVGVDISEKSLAHTRMLMEKYNIKNLELKQLPIEKISELNQDFDLIVSTGVLHHMADPCVGLSNLREMLRPMGAAYLMVYGYYGRLGVYMMQKYGKLLGVDLTDGDLADFQKVLLSIPGDHPLIPIAKRSRDLAFLSGIADMFVHPRDRAYDVEQVYEWLEKTGFQMMRWFMQAYYLPQSCGLATTPHFEKINQLTSRKKHAAVELYRGHLHKHSFVVCRDDRPVESFEIDWQGDAWEQFVPMPFRGITANTKNLPKNMLVELAHAGHEFPVVTIQLNQANVLCYQAMDGKRTLSEITKKTQVPAHKIKTFYKLLWEFDQIEIYIKNKV